MPRTVSDVDTLQEYIQGVMEKAEHHATGVDEAALVIVGVVLWRKDPDRKIKVIERDGQMANVLWVWIGGARYALSYKHKRGAIEVRRRSLRGERLELFDNNTPVAAIRDFFAGL